MLNEIDLSLSSLKKNNTPFATFVINNKLDIKNIKELVGK